MGNTESVVAVKARVKHPHEVLGYAIDFTDLLAAAETISSVDDITILPDDEDDPDALAFDDEEVNAVTVVDDEGNTIAVGKAVAFALSAGEAGTDYRITVDVTTSTGNERTAVVVLYVRDGSV